MFDQSTRLCDIKYKIVFLGHSSVGKSALIQRFIQATFDPGKSVLVSLLQQTVGIDFLVKNIHYKGSVYRLQLWDTAGQQKFKSLVPNYIKDAHCAVFVYDVARRQTFQGVKIWLQLFREHSQVEAVSILVGNKTDLKEERVITREDGVAMATQQTLSFCQTSAKTGQGVQQLFHSIIDNIHAPKDLPQPLPELQSHRSSSASTATVNKAKLVKITEDKKKLSCCYI